MLTVGTLWKKYYPWYNRTLFVDTVLVNTAKGNYVLEIGAGSGLLPQHSFPLKGHADLYVGVDVDERVEKNPNLDIGRIANAERLPFPDNYFDVVFSCMVAEHLENPAMVLEECARVLKLGGRLLIQTPSKWHYAMLIARLVPNRFHSFVMHGLLKSKRTEREIFPTFYRMNDEHTIRKLMHKSGFCVEVVHFSAPPGYLTFSRIAFALGILYERTFERLFPALRCTLIICAWKAKHPRQLQRY